MKNRSEFGDIGEFIRNQLYLKTVSFKTCEIFSIEVGMDELQKFCSDHLDPRMPIFFILHCVLKLTP